MVAPLNVGLIGFGNIGTGVLRALATNGALITPRVPHPIQIKRIADLDTTTPRNAPYEPGILTNDVDALLNDPEINVVLELTGTMDFARELIDRALKAKKHVVTANKALLAVHGMDLMRTAVDNKVCLLFEAAVGGGIPLIRTLHQGLAANDIQAIRGIINGTANYILTEMTERQLDFNIALEQAQKLGYAEPDPTFDVEGHDTAHKLAILASLCFNQDIRFEDVAREGITRVTAVDIAFAAELGYTIKLLGIAKRHPDDSVEARVHPTLLPSDSRLASVNGVFNAVRIDGNLTGPVILSGRGAGPDPTASAILSDLMVLASAKAEGGLRREMRLSVATGRKKVRPMDDLLTAYCIRFGMMDRPGAMAQILRALGEHNVSVASIKQPFRQQHQESFAHVLVVTHEAKESDLRASLKNIETLEVNRAEPFVMYIEEMD
ncbi:homoserine dehydrogenase [bacterium]|nr:homoserine dehydrogenase [bacterium]